LVLRQGAQILQSKKILTGLVIADQHLGAHFKKNRVVAVAGFRIFEALVDGRRLYVDDLVTSAGERSQGHGAALLRWLETHAVAEGCETLQLDSGLQRKRAHRFYEREGMHVSSLHFRKPLG
jgi:GNAT superfamily N-acetyltransferase